MAKIKLHDVRKRCPDGELYIFKKGVAQVPGMRPPMFVTLAEFNQLSKEVEYVAAENSD